jgi:murein DD-endopeptidase MepM/ murein hydrolase activator NlpD
MKLTFFAESGYEVDLAEIDDKELAADLQFYLNRAGYPLTVDGIIGEKTLFAWARFKKDNYLGEPNKIGSSSVKLLLKLPEVKKGYFLPTDGIGWVSSPFGARGNGFHKGIDIACNKGTPIYAVADGIVSTAIDGCKEGNWKCGGGYGNVVYIEHQRIAFSQTRYAHLHRLAAGISTGNPIKAGQIIGYCGNTGHSFGDHLHFEIRVSGVAKNPLSFINPIV